MKHVFLLVVLACAVMAVAAEPVGRVSGLGALSLNRVALPATAVASVPVVVGDEIATSNSPATLILADRSRAILAPNSRVRVGGVKMSLKLRVLAGSVDLKRAAGSQVSLVKPGVQAAVGSSGSTANPAAAATTPAPAPAAPKPVTAPAVKPLTPRSPHCPPHNPHCE